MRVTMTFPGFTSRCTTPCSVRRRERIAQHGTEARHALDRPGCISAEAIEERLAEDELLHLEEHPVVGDVDVKHANDRRMRDGRGRARLVQEAMKRVELLAELAWITLIATRSLVDRSSPA